MIPRFVLLAVLLLFSGLATAAVYDLPSDGNDIIGEVIHIKTDEEDTFVALGRHFNVGYSELKLANPDVDPWLPGEGTEIAIPRQFILPDAPREGIVVNLAEMRLYYFPAQSDENAGKVFTYPLGIGREGWGTPLGTTTIVRKKEDPTWHPPASIRKEHAEAGDPLPTVVPAGPDNPLGEYALYLGFQSYLMHGTNKPSGIGLRVSHGCLRLFPEDISSLFAMVGTGTKVTIIDQPYKFGWQDGKLYMEAHPPDADGELQVHAYTPWVEALIDATAKHPDIQIDWDHAQTMARQTTGIPAKIQGNQ